MSNWRVNGVDLDTIFAAGSGGAATNLRNAGADLNTRYAVRSSGSVTTGIRIAGVDIGSTRFQSINVVVTTDVGSVSGSRSGAGTVASGSVTATATGGTPGYTYLWEFVSGDAGISIIGSTSPTTNFSATLTNGQTLAAYYRCKVTDSALRVAYSGNVLVTLSSTYVAPLTASASPTVVSGYAARDPFPAPPTSLLIYTDATTVTPSGGTGPYTYAWTQVSGDPFTCNNPTAATTTFRSTVAKASTNTSVWRCTVTDSLSATATVDINASCTYEIL